MTNTDNRQFNKELYYRLIAFWAASEGFAGGIMHAVKMPFTGLVVSSLSVLSIVLIGYHCRGRLSILKATLLVCIFKLMLSPHSPPTAYLAVGFQGLMGQLLFMRRFSRPGAIFLGVLALVESSIQRILVMIFIYGVSFWEAVNAYVKKTVGSDGSIDILYWLAAGYILIHFLAGLMVGYFASVLASTAGEARKKYPHFIISEIPETGELETTGIKRRKIRFFMWAAFLLLLLFYIQSKVDPGNSVLPTGKVMDIFLRAFLILFIWYSILSPLLTGLLKRYLEKSRERNREDFSRINALVPGMRHIFIMSARLSGEAKGLRRVRLFFTILVMNITGK